MAIRTSYSLFNQWPDLHAEGCLHAFKASTAFTDRPYTLSLLSFVPTVALLLRCKQ
jgi:hypothetical protein